MSTGKIQNNYQEISRKSNDLILHDQFNISKAVIPFSKMFKSYKPRDIYSGNENIPFKDKDPEFKMLLRQEFNGLKVTKYLSKSCSIFRSF